MGKQGLTYYSTYGEARVSPTLKQTHSRYEVETHETVSFEHATMAPARGRVATRKRKTKKTPRASSSLSSDCSREPSPVRYSEYEVQRKAKIARNAECLGSLEIAKIPARAQAAKKESAPQVCPREPALFCGPFDRLRVCLGAQVAA